MLKHIFHFILFLLPLFSFSQTFIQDQDDAMIGLDRKAFNGIGNISQHSDGYAHDFTLPSGTSCQKISSIQVVVTITSYTLNSPAPGCTPDPVYFNIYKGCGVYSGGATCAISNVITEQPFPPPGSFPNIRTFNFGCPLNGAGLTAEFGDNFSVDIIPVATPGCNSVASNYVDIEYTIAVTITFGNITCSSTGCLAGNKTMQPCDDGNPCTINDMQTILNCDGSICVPCAGTVSGPPPVPTFTQVAAICAGASLSALPATSNNGITGTWSPALNNTATTTYTFAPDAGQCATMATMTITVNPLVTPTFTQVAAICAGASLSALPTTSNNSITGTWSPALNNTATTTYTFAPDGGQCATMATMTITVNPLVTPTFTQVSAICAGASLNALPTTSDNSITGIWSPALNNTATTTYTFTPDGGQCATMATMTITVNPLVTPTFTQVSAICAGASLSALPTTSDNSITGIWSPALNNTATTTYTFAPDAGQCATMATMTITVNPLVAPTFTQLGPYCQNATPGILSTSSSNSTTIAGTWSPSLINTSVVGSQVYTFTPDAGQCGTQLNMTIDVTAPVLPIFDQLGPYCLNAIPDVLPTSSNSSPPITGTWDLGIINTSFPGITIYTFIPSSVECALSTTMTVEVLNSVIPTFDQLGPYCLNASPDILPSFSNNFPPITGTWDPGIINTSTVGFPVYTFTPSSGECALSTTMTVDVSSSVTPTFVQLGPYCLNSTPGILPVQSSNNINGTWSPSVINTSAVGSFTYTFTPAAGQCGVVTSMTVVITGAITPIFAQLGPYCQNAVPVPLPTNSNNIPQISGAWSPSVISTSVIGTQVYTFTPNPGQCGTTTTMTVAITAPVTPSFSQLGPFCQNAIPGNLPLISTNSTPIAGTWSPSVINTSAVGSTVYTFTPNSGQCAATTSMTIVITAPDTPTFTQAGPYCLNSIPGLLPTSSNNMTPISGTWSPSVVNTSILGSAVYTFTPNVGQCASVTTMTIVVTNSITPQFTPLAIFCQNETPGILPLNSTNSPSITGTWSPGVVNTSTPGSTIYTFTPAPGQCAGSTTMTVVVTAPITPVFTQLGPYCQNATSGILPSSSNNSPSITGNWSPSVINTSTIGTQTYTFTPGAGTCSTVTTMNITITAPVSPSFTQLGPYCQNETPGVLPVSSSNSTPITGTWSPSVVNTSAPGSQVYTFTPNGGQCSNQATMTITVTAPLLPTFSHLGPYCLNATPGLLPVSSTNVTPVTGTWSPAVVNTSAIGSTVHTFTPSGGQCALPTTMTIEVSNSLAPIFNQLGPYCVNSTPANLSAISSNGITGTWSPSTINTTVPGSYVHTFTPNPGQCGTPTTMTIVITNPVIPTFLQLGPYCQNEITVNLPSVSINALPISGTWSPAIISTSVIGTQVYTFTPSAGQCASVTTMSIETKSPTLPAFTQLGPYCQNTMPGSLPVFSNNTIPIPGTWTPATISTSVAGSSVYTFTPNTGQCASNATMTITITNPVLPAFTQLGPYCQNTTPGVLPASSANTPTITGIWSPAVVNTSIIGTSVYTFTPNMGQCASGSTMNITISAPPVPTFTPFGPYCQNQNPDILPTSSTNVPPITGTWTPSVINTSATGTNVYTFTPASGQCGSPSNMTITVLSGPSSVVTDIVNATCGQSNGAVSVGQVSGGISPYAFNFNNLGFGTVVSFTNLASGSYPLSIRDGNGCLYSTFVIIGSSGLTCGSNPACEVTLPCNDNDPCTVNDVEVQLLADGSICKPCAGVQIECEDDFVSSQSCDDGDPSTINDMETVLDCDGSICVPCKGQPAPANVFIPNVFTPNGDGNNDYFTVYSGPNVKIIQELKIYDRWGSNLFSAVNIPANDNQAGWDGLYKGSKVGPGVYVYFAKIEFFDGQVIVRNGTITMAW